MQILQTYTVRYNHLKDLKGKYMQIHFTQTIIFDELTLVLQIPS